MTQKDILLRTLAQQMKNNIDPWIITYNLIKTNTSFGWLGTSADSLARKLRQDGLVESKDEGKYTLFKITEKGLEYLKSKNSPIQNEFEAKWPTRVVVKGLF